MKCECAICGRPIYKDKNGKWHHSRIRKIKQMFEALAGKIHTPIPRTL